MASNSAKIIMAGGYVIHVQSMILYEEQLLQEVTALAHEADRKVGGSDNNVGFMGSPSFVIGAFLSASAYSRWQQARLSREAQDLIEIAKEKYELTLTSGREFQWADIEHSDWADPARWRAMAYENLKRKTFVPNPDGDMRVRTVDNTWIWVMWRHVAAYEPIE